MDGKRRLHHAPPPLARPPRRRHRGAGRWRARLVVLVTLGAGGWLGWSYFERHFRPSAAPQAATEPAPADAPAGALPDIEPQLVDPFAPRPPAGVPPAAGVPGAQAQESAATPAVSPPGASPAPPPAPAAGPATAQLESDFRPRLPRDVFEAQIALTRDAICPGSIDGAFGGQTRAAILAFQEKHGLRRTGQLDNQTREALTLRQPPLTSYTVTADDFLRLRPLPKGWIERAALDRLDYSTILELVAEKHFSSPKQIRALNPSITWDRLQTGSVIVVPAVPRQAPASRPARIVIHLSARTLELFDGDSRLLAHFPCSIGRRVEKRPVGGLSVVTVAPDPDYTFDPANFPDSAEAQRVGRRLKLPPGPNNPVGVAWITLTPPEAGNVSNFGIHGSPEPEQIGRTESSGCFRLANWNASYLLPLVYPGMPVQVEP